VEFYKCILDKHAEPPPKPAKKDKAKLKAIGYDDDFTMGPLAVEDETVQPTKRRRITKKGKFCPGVVEPLAIEDKSAKMEDEGVDDESVHSKPDDPEEQSSNEDNSSEYQRPDDDGGEETPPMPSAPVDPPDPPASPPQPDSEGGGGGGHGVGAKSPGSSGSSGGKSSGVQGVVAAPTLLPPVLPAPPPKSALSPPELPPDPDSEHGDGNGRDRLAISMPTMPGSDDGPSRDGESFVWHESVRFTKVKKGRRKTFIGWQAFCFHHRHTADTSDRLGDCTRTRTTNKAEGISDELSSIYLRQLMLWASNGTLFVDRADHMDQDIQPDADLEEIQELDDFAMNRKGERLRIARRALACHAASGSASGVVAVASEGPGPSDELAAELAAPAAAAAGIASDTGAARRGRSGGRGTGRGGGNKSDSNDSM
jgi:hypothetical protein